MLDGVNWTKLGQRNNSHGDECLCGIIRDHRSTLRLATATFDGVSSAHRSNPAPGMTSVSQPPLCGQPIVISVRALESTQSGSVVL